MQAINAESLRNAMLSNSAIRADPPETGDGIARIFGRMVGKSKDGIESATRWATRHAKEMERDVSDQYRGLIAKRSAKDSGYTVRGDEWKKCTIRVCQHWEMLRAREFANIQSSGHYARKEEASRAWYSHTARPEAHPVISPAPHMDAGQAKLMSDRDAAFNHARACNLI